MTRSSWLTGALLAALFLALHLPFLAPSLDDVDAINFALGVRDYDVSKHQPHPPGYPLFIVAAKGLHRAGLSEVHALSLLSVVGGALGVFGCFAFFRVLDSDTLTSFRSWLAVVVVITCPLYWITAARPLTDTVGLAAALAVQALIVTAPSVATLALAAALAGFVVGLRSQIVWLTVPLLVLTIVRLPGIERWRALRSGTVAYAIGALAWVIPLLVVSGPMTYLQTIWHQGAEDVGGVAMLATTHTVSLLVTTLRGQLIAPWGYWQLAAAVLTLGIAGVGAMLARARPALTTVIVAFGPYLVFDFLFEEAVTTRYALPLIVPASYLVVRGASLVNRNVGVLAAVAVAATSIVVDDATIYGYAGMPAPVFRMIGDMHEVAGRDSQRPVLATHRNQYFSMRRPIQWAGDQMPAVAAQLPAPSRHEWLEVVNYWNAGGRAPVWFVADPLRSDLALFRNHQRRPTLYRWPFRFTGLVGGARPDELDWYVIDAPDWYLGEGWALTPETAGVAAAEHHGPGYGGIRGWVRRSAQRMTLMVGGRNLAANGSSVHVRVALDGVDAENLAVAPGFFLSLSTIQPSSGPGDYVPLAIESDSPQVAIEQFDAQPAGRLVYGFGDGWNEQEYNPATGALWRWTTDRSNIRVRAEGHAVALTLRGEIEAANTSHVVVRAGTSVTAAFDVGRSFSRTILIPAAALPGPEDVITIESSAWYVPAEKRWRSRDQRRLGLKLYECAVTPAS